MPGCESRSPSDSRSKCVARQRRTLPDRSISSSQHGTGDSPGRRASTRVLEIDLSACLVAAIRPSGFRSESGSRRHPGRAIAARPTCINRQGLGLLPLTRVGVYRYPRPSGQPSHTTAFVSVPLRAESSRLTRTRVPSRDKYGTRQVTRNPGAGSLVTPHSLVAHRTWTFQVTSKLAPPPPTRLWMTYLPFPRPLSSRP